MSYILVWGEWFEPQFWHFPFSEIPLCPLLFSSFSRFFFVAFYFLRLSSPFVCESSAPVYFPCVSDYNSPFSCYSFTSFALAVSLDSTSALAVFLCVCLCCVCMFVWCICLCSLYVFVDVCVRWGFCLLLHVCWILFVLCLGCLSQPVSVLYGMSSLSYMFCIAPTLVCCSLCRSTSQSLLCLHHVGQWALLLCLPCFCFLIDFMFLSVFM